MDDQQEQCHHPSRSSLRTSMNQQTRPISRLVSARRLATRGSLCFNNTMLMFTSVANISVSSDPNLRQQVKDMGTWLEKRLQDYGVKTKQVSPTETNSRSRKHAGSGRKLSLQ